MENQKVFGIGLSKTGTTSLFAAFHMLGYRAGTYRHMKRKGLSKWFKGDFSHDYIDDFDAITDLPIGAFYPSLDNKYPGSKFILTTRKKADWLNSCKRFFALQKRNLEKAGSFYNQTQLSTYGIASFDEAQFSHIYDCHEDNVRNYFRGRDNDLLVISITEGDGWEKLCPFLEKPIPDCDFPKVLPGGFKLPEESEVKQQVHGVTTGLRKAITNLSLNMPG